MSKADCAFRLDAHVHSCFSTDSSLEPDRILKTARQRGLKGVAVCDHQTVAGGLATFKANRDPGFLVIPGAEYATNAGHIQGLFLTRELPIKEQAPWQEVVEAIHSEGGIAVLAHPQKFRRPLPQELLQALDAMEGFNARAHHSANRQANSDAADLAHRAGLPLSGGSDAHWAGEIGNGYWEVEGVEQLSGAEFRRLLLQGAGKVGGISTPLVYESMSQTLKALRLRTYGRIPRIAAKCLLAYMGVNLGRGGGKR